MRKIYKKKLLFLIALVLLFSSTYGQLTGVKKYPGWLLNCCVSDHQPETGGVGAGGVTFNIAAGYTETFTSPTAGLITATGTSADPIIFQKSGSGLNPVITAGIGVSTSVDGIIVLRGSDYVTFDGIDLTESAGNSMLLPKWNGGMLW